MHGSLLAVLVVSVLLAALARRFDVSAPLALVVAGLAASTIPGFTDIELEPEPRALRPAAAAAVVGGPGEQLRRAEEQPPSDRPARRRAAAGDDVRGRLRRVQDGAGPDAGGRSHPRRDRRAAGRGIGDGGRAQARAAAPDHDAARRREPAQRCHRADRLQGGARRGDRRRRDLGQRPCYVRARRGRRHRRSAWRWAFRHRLHPVAARRSAGGKRRRPGRAVRHLPRRRGSTRLRGARRRRRGAHPRSEVFPRRLRDPAAGPGGVEGPSAGAGVVRVPDDRPSAADRHRRDPRHVVHRRSRPTRLAVLATVIVVRIVWVYAFAYPAEDAVAAHPGARAPRRRSRRCSSSRGQACAAWSRWPPRSPCR